MKPMVDFSDALGQAKKYDVQIIRDEWGIPHILGKTDADTAHGLAYAQPRMTLKRYRMCSLLCAES
ncbi:MAG: hypothetical protein CM1200mP29_17570 [Verrucomicrobiota bacterium]|nr:MAG: hypothetical protein CM1200mP29_17570 [Verrucomicrobiota bacterium]